VGLTLHLVVVQLGHGREIVFSHRFKSMAHRYSDQPNPPSWYGPVFTALFVVLFGGAFWLALTSSLDQMTERDCRLGVQTACEALK
jgi:hypothetical protein